VPIAPTLNEYISDRRAKIGLTDGMVRISAGIEDPQDLIEDLAQALG